MCELSKECPFHTQLFRQLSTGGIIGLKQLLTSQYCGETTVIHPFDSVRVKLSLAGKPPAALLQGTLFLENRYPESSSWSDPGTAGSTLLRNILRSQPVELSTLQGVVNPTTGNLGKAGCNELPALMGLRSFGEKAAELMVRNASTVFASGQANAKNLIRMEVTKSYLASDRRVITSTRTLERRMYAMNSDGICFVVGPEIYLDAEKLPSADFLITEDEMDAADASR